MSSDKIYNRISRLNPDKLQNTANSILNKFINNNRRGVRSFIIDTTPGDLKIYVLIYYLNIYM